MSRFCWHIIQLIRGASFLVFAFIAALCFAGSFLEILSIMDHPIPDLRFGGLHRIFHICIPWLVLQHLFFFRRYPNSEVTLARNEELNSLWGTTADSVYDLSLSGFANREACKPLHDNILVEVVASHCMISLNSRRKLYFFEFPYVIKHGLNSRAMLADTRG